MFSNEPKQSFDEYSPSFICPQSAQRSGAHLAPIVDSALGMRYYAELIAL